MTEVDKDTDKFSIDWNKATNHLILVIGIGVVVNLLFSYFISGDFRLQDLLRFTPISLVLAFVFAIFPWVGHALEIMIWAKFFAKPMSFRAAMRISIATDLGSAITPTMVGGAPIKLGMLIKRGLSGGQAAAMVIFTGIEDMCFFLVIIPLSIIYSDRIGLDILDEVGAKYMSSIPKMIIVGISIVVALVVLLFLLKKSKLGQSIRLKILSILEDFKFAMSFIVKSGKTTFFLATLAIASRWVTRFFILVFLVKGFGVSVDLTEIYLSEWLVYMGMTVTPTPGAIGGAEIGFKLVYNSLIPSDAMGSIVFAWRFFNYFLLLILAALFLNLTNKWKSKKEIKS